MVTLSCVSEEQKVIEDVSDVPDLNSIKFIAPMALLCVFNVIVIFGNGLVIVAVLTEERLRTVTNTFVLSLAVSDLLLGLTVLPFSSAKEVLNIWPFGKQWCSFWLAVDVLLCTSSILNLCAISFDRFLAIGYPFKYHRWLSPRRTRYLIAGVWTLAFLICIPPLLGWNEGSGWTEIFTESSSGSRNLSQEIIPRGVVPNRPEENNNEDDSLVKYKLLNSPSNGINFVQNESCKDSSSSGIDSERIIRLVRHDCALSSNSGYVIYSACGSFWIPMCVMVFFYWRVYVTARRATVAHRRGVIVRNVRPDSTRELDPTGTDTNGAVTVALRVHRGGMTTFLSSPALHSLTPETRRSIAEKIGGRDLEYINQLTIPGKNKIRKDQRLPSTSNRQETLSTRDRSTTSSPRNKNYMSNHLSKEHKAAKTIGIIVGCFIACWAPFFTVYLLGAFCKDCTHSMIFTVFFWLGYFNSALNPIIYALYSRDFRISFQRLLTCRRSTGRRWTSQDVSGSSGRVDRLIMMAQLHGPLNRPPDLRKTVPAVGGILAVSMPSSVYMLRR